MTAALPIVARRIRVRGIVQGVGFRPHVWHLATALQLAGSVHNDADGVEITVEGPPAPIAQLLIDLRAKAPPLARIDRIDTMDVAPQGLAGFVIADSVGGRNATAIGPDVATCPACLADLCDAHGRRWRHAFVTCTHCGPRYTVTRTLPYDRPQTTLAPFALCPDCAREYADPADRRYHAETTCCPVCGPQLRFRHCDGTVPAGDPIALALALLRAGGIVAIKGLGGFHLACDARNAGAVGRLRERKARDQKPFAIMAANADSIAGWVSIDEDARALLESRERPIVLLPVAGGVDAQLPGVAPGLDALGVMLPATPIQTLLWHEAAGRPSDTGWLAQAQPLLLVMTSANPGGEPIVRDNDEAMRRLAGIADAVLDHDRDIVACCDDSVVVRHRSATRFIRRSRGHAPGAVRLPHGGPAVVAFGAHLKNTVCVTHNDEAFLSPHIGDLVSAATCRFLDATVVRLLDLLAVQPAVVAHDLLPDSWSTQAAIAFADHAGLPCVAVQHHHAHVAAVCAEHDLTGPVLGIALDGVGLGTDGTAWGGELLVVDGAQAERVGYLRPLPLPGGDRAAREPWRMAAAALHALGDGAQIGARFAPIVGAAAADAVAAMLARDLRCPPTSSMGRVFDAAAGLLGLCPVAGFEAQAAIRIEQVAARHVAATGRAAPLAGGWAIDAGNRLDLRPLLAAMADAGAARGANIDAAAACFHTTLVAALADWIIQVAAQRRLDTVVGGGGCFFNRLLADGLTAHLATRGLALRLPQRVSPGDGGIALGQAWVAMQAKGH